MADGIDAGATGVRVLMSRLDPLVAQALELSYFRGLTQTQIAEELRLPRESVARTLATGLRELAGLLAEDVPAGSGDRDRSGGPAYTAVARVANSIRRRSEWQARAIRSGEASPAVSGSG